MQFFSGLIGYNSFANEEDPSKKLQPKITVKLFLHASGNIAAKFPYDQVLNMPD